MIILTTAQANQVRGLKVPGQALAPKPIRVGANVFISGMFALPEAVLTDPTYSDFWPLLQTCPIHSVANGVSTSIDQAPTGGDWDLDPTVLANNNYNSTWPVGQLVTVGPSAV